MSAIPCEPFASGDVIAVFYDGPQDRLSFYRNGALQHTFVGLYCLPEARVSPQAALPAFMAAPLAMNAGASDKVEICMGPTRMKIFGRCC